MIKPTLKKLVNWQDCMSVSAKHFVQTEDYFIDLSRDYASLQITNYNYGLLPTGSSNNISNGIRISEHITGHIEIKLMQCNAITSSGIRISFNPDNEEYLMKNYSPETSSSKGLSYKETKQWDIILVANPFERKPTGELNVNETPPRHPHAESMYELQVVPTGEIETSSFGLHHLTIGRIKKNADRFEVDSNYIPPCTCMASHPDLMDYYNRFAQQLNSIEKSSKAIISKVQNRQNTSTIATNVEKVCQEVMRYIANIYFEFRNKGRALPPIDVVKYFSTLAHICYVSLSYMRSDDKEELLKYFYEWSDITPGSFEEILANSLELIYEHDKIRATMYQVDSFLTIFTELWVKLSQLDYIGQHKENIIVSERSNQIESTQKSSWSIID